MPFVRQKNVMENKAVLDELQKILIEQLRRSGLPVTLLCIGIWASWELRQTDKKELTESFQLHKLESGLEIKALRIQVEQCNEQRFEAYREIATLKTQVEFLTARQGRNK